MKQWIVLVVFLFSFATAFSQKQKEAKDLLDKATEKLQSKQGSELSFSSSTFHFNQLKGEVDGHLYIKGESFMLKTEEMQTWYDGETQWSLIFDMEEVNITNPTEEELLEINPYQLLQLYQKGYSYVLGQEKSNNQEIILKAQDKFRNYQVIRVWLNKTSFEPTSLQVETRDNTTNKIIIRQIKTNVRLVDSLFKFNKASFPEVDIIDLR